MVKIFLFVHFKINQKKKWKILYVTNNDIRDGTQVGYDIFMSIISSLNIFIKVCKKYCFNGGVGNLDHLVMELN